MEQITKRRNLFFASTAILFLVVAGSARAQAGVTMIPGSLPDGATYLIEVPANWNGTLFLYSHGYVVPGSSNPAQDVGDPVTRFFMLSSGFALAGSSYATTGWAIHEALPDQIAVFDLFKKMVGHPKRTHRVGTLARRNHHRWPHPAQPGSFCPRSALVRCTLRRRRHMEHRAGFRVCFQDSPGAWNWSRVSF